MQFSVREAKAQFAHAANAAAAGEKVVITKHGKPFVELVPAAAIKPETKYKGDLWERLDQAQAALGLKSEDYPWPDEFNDPEFTKLAMGLDD